MIPAFGDLPAWTLAWIAGVMLISGFTHHARMSATAPETPR